MFGSSTWASRWYKTQAGKVKDVIAALVAKGFNQVAPDGVRIVEGSSFVEVYFSKDGSFALTVRTRVKKLPT